jgi:hypothetical protein
MISVTNVEEKTLQPLPNSFSVGVEVSSYSWASIYLESTFSNTGVHERRQHS